MSAQPLPPHLADLPKLGRQFDRANKARRFGKRLLGQGGAKSRDTDNPGASLASQAIAGHTSIQLEHAKIFGGVVARQHSSGIAHQMLNDHPGITDLNFSAENNINVRRQPGWHKDMGPENKPSAERSAEPTLHDKIRESKPRQELPAPRPMLALEAPRKAIEAPREGFRKTSEGGSDRVFGAPDFDRDNSGSIPAGAPRDRFSEVEDRMNKRFDDLGEKTNQRIAKAAGKNYGDKQGAPAKGKNPTIAK